MRLKVGLLNDSFPPTIDGVANAVVNYANIISDKFGNVVVVTPKYPGVVDNHKFEVYRYNSLSVPGPLPYRAGNPFSPITIAELKSKKLDLLHVHSPFASSILAKQITTGNHRVPIVFTYHTKFDYDIDKYVTNSQLNKVAKKIVLRNINSADEVWVVSSGAGESIRNLGYKGNYRVMQNGTDFKRGKASADIINELRQLHNIAEDEKVFLFVGRMMWYKNIKLILDSLEIVKREGVKFHALFVGEGTDRPDIEKYANKLQLQTYTTFTGAIRDREKVRAYFSLADLFLFPSTYDTSGLVVKEAAACSCPSLLIEGSCAAEDVEDDNSGILARENAVSCSSRLLESLKHDDFLKTIGKTACDKVYMSWEDAVVKAYRRYEELIESWPLPLPNLYKMKR